MAGTLKTTFFKLVKYAANDITSWLTDFNGNMDKIDTALNQNKQAAATAQDGVDNLESEYESLLGVVNGHTTSINSVEKAVQGNTTAIEGLEQDINKIIIGDYIAKKNTDSDVTRIENLATYLNMFARRIGTGIQAGGAMEFNPGTMHTYNRQIPSGMLANYYVTDIYRITGNPFNLENNNYCPVNGSIFTLGDNVLKQYDGLILVIVYISEANYTVIGYASKYSSAINVPEIGTRVSIG